MQNYGMNLFFGTLWFFMIVAIASPETVGEWEARRDTGFFSIMDEYYGDMDMETYE